VREFEKNYFGPVVYLITILIGKSPRWREENNLLKYCEKKGNPFSKNKTINNQ